MRGCPRTGATRRSRRPPWTGRGGGGRRSECATAGAASSQSFEPRRKPPPVRPSRRFVEDTRPDRAKRGTPAAFVNPGVVQSQIHAPALIGSALRLTLEMIEMRAQIDGAGQPAVPQLQTEIGILEVAYDVRLVEAADVPRNRGAHHHARGSDGEASSQLALGWTAPALSCVNRKV